MKSYTVAAFVGLFAMATATTLADIPGCALTCMLTANAADPAKCSATDVACNCGSSYFVSSVTACIPTACTGDSLALAVKNAAALCAENGVTVSTSAIDDKPTTSAAPAPSTTAAEPSTTTAEASATATSATTTTAAAVSTKVATTSAVSGGNSTNTTGGTVHPTQSADSAAGKLTGALSFVGLGLLAALAI